MPVVEAMASGVPSCALRTRLSTRRAGTRPSGPTRELEALRSVHSIGARERTSSRRGHRARRAVHAAGVRRSRFWRATRNMPDRLRRGSRAALCRDAAGTAVVVVNHDGGEPDRPVPRLDLQPEWPRERARDRRRRQRVARWGRSSRSSGASRRASRPPPQRTRLRRSGEPRLLVGSRTSTTSRS